VIAPETSPPAGPATPAAGNPGPHAGFEGDTRLSQVLPAIAVKPGRDRIAIGDLLVELDQRAIAALLFIFAVPNTIPVPPGVSAVLGAPLIFLAAQFMLGRGPWLPRLITERSFLRLDFEKIVGKVAPWLARAESLMRPRLTILARRPFENLVGFVCLVLAVVLFLPIPLGNMLPSIAICVLALGVLARDGIWILAGLGLAAAALAVVSGVLLAFAYALVFAVQAFLGT